jgi:hypothetical protein
MSTVRKKLPRNRFSPLGIALGTRLARRVTDRSARSARCRGHWRRWWHSDWRKWYRVLKRRFEDPGGLYHPTADPIDPGSGLRYPTVDRIGGFLNRHPSVIRRDPQIVLCRCDRIGQWAVRISRNGFRCRLPGSCPHRGRIGGCRKIARRVRRRNSRRLIPWSTHHGVGLTTPGGRKKREGQKRRELPIS